MEEKSISFIRNEDPTPVVLSEKQQKEYKKASDDLRFASVHLNNELAGGKLETGMKDTLCSLVESYVQTMTKVLGYEGVLHKEKEERYKEIRDLNTENRELRKQLGQKVSPEDVRESLKNLTENFKRWWNIEGFGHSSDEHFHGYAFTVKLSGMIGHAYYDKNDPEASYESKTTKLEKMGFQIRPGDSRHDCKILYNNHNMKLVEELIKSKYPSASITYSKAWHGRSKDDSEIREIEIVITNFDELV